MIQLDKTNVMRILDSKQITYVPHYYDNNIVDGLSVSAILNQPPTQVFKTLVTVGNNLLHYVFVIPVNKSLNLKKAAKAVNIKSIEMIKQSELLPLTGYIHGGCSPIAMKKPFITVINSSAQNQPTICVSAGKIGCQIELNPYILATLINCKFDDIVD
ncbi:MAG: Cys-tRNA(Pro) deacylase [Clostridia bacterium]